MLLICLIILLFVLILLLWLTLLFLLLLFHYSLLRTKLFWATFTTHVWSTIVIPFAILLRLLVAPWFIVGKCIGFGVLPICLLASELLIHSLFNKFIHVSQFQIITLQVMIMMKFLLSISHWCIKCSFVPNLFVF